MRWKPRKKTAAPAMTIAVPALLLLTAGNVARAAFHVEIPLGILTAVVGAPFFLCLLPGRRKRARQRAK